MLAAKYIVGAVE